MFVYTLGTTVSKSSPITELPVQVLSPVPSGATHPSSVPDLSNHPYEKFLSGQEERKLEWKAQRAAKIAKSDQITAEMPESSSNKDQNQSQDKVSLLRKELDAKTDECQELKSQLAKAAETNAEALKAQLTAQENFSKVSVEPYIARYQKLICSENVTKLNLNSYSVTRISIMQYH